MEADFRYEIINKDSGEDEGLRWYSHWEQLSSHSWTMVMSFKIPDNARLYSIVDSETQYISSTPFSMQIVHHLEEGRETVFSIEHINASSTDYFEKDTLLGKPDYLVLTQHYHRDSCSFRCMITGDRDFLKDAFMRMRFEWVEEDKAIYHDRIYAMKIPIFPNSYCRVASKGVGQE